MIDVIEAQSVETTYYPHKVGMSYPITVLVKWNGLLFIYLVEWKLGSEQMNNE